MTLQREVQTKRWPPYSSLLELWMLVRRAVGDGSQFALTPAFPGPPCSEGSARVYE